MKWYKDDIEFYTYIPRMRDGMKQRFFDVPGVQIDVSTYLNIFEYRTNSSEMIGLGPIECHKSSSVRLSYQVTKFKVHINCIQIGNSSLKLAKLRKVPGSLLIPPNFKACV